MEAELSVGWQPAVFQAHTFCVTHFLFLLMLKAQGK